MSKSLPKLAHLRNLDLRGILADTVKLPELGPGADPSIDQAVDEILAAAKSGGAPTLNHVFPRTADALRDVLNRAYIAHASFGVQAVKELIIRPPRALVLKGEPHRITAIGAFVSDAQGAGRQAVLLELTTEKGADPAARWVLRATDPVVLDLPTEPSIEATAKGLFAIALEEVVLKSAEPLIAHDWGGLRPASAVWLGDPVPAEMLPDWKARLRAVGAVAGFTMEVVAAEHQLAATGSRTRSLVLGHERDVLLMWEGHVDSDQRSVASDFAKSQRHRVKTLHDQTFNGAIESARLALDEATDEWPYEASRPASGQVVRKCFQKKGAGGGPSDQFEPRANPCNHNALQAVRHADKAEKGAEKIVGDAGTVRSLEKCMSTGCHVYWITYVTA